MESFLPERRTANSRRERVDFSISGSGGGIADDETSSVGESIQLDEFSRHSTLALHTVSGYLSQKFLFHYFQVPLSSISEIHNESDAVRHYTRGYRPLATNADERRRRGPSSSSQ